ncbi:MAG: hypothetical protein H6845_01950 [Alphaproteobacteria bacterium]|nr:MAG: hypothetical protein H6845_01950 [Alphaproteobacteria bacterium]
MLKKVGLLFFVLNVSTMPQEEQGADSPAFRNNLGTSQSTIGGESIISVHEITTAKDALKTLMNNLHTINDTQKSEIIREVKTLLDNHEFPLFGTAFFEIVNHSSKLIDFAAELSSTNLFNDKKNLSIAIINEVKDLVEKEQRNEFLTQFSSYKQSIESANSTNSAGQDKNTEEAASSPKKIERVDSAKNSIDANVNVSNRGVALGGKTNGINMSMSMPASSKKGGGCGFSCTSSGKSSPNHSKTASPTKNKHNL